MNVGLRFLARISVDEVGYTKKRLESCSLVSVDELCQSDRNGIKRRFSK